MVLTQNGQFERFFVRKFSDRTTSKSVLSHGIARMHILKIQFRAHCVVFTSSMGLMLSKEVLCFASECMLYEARAITWYI
jgi:hypothetical protein